MQQWREVYAAPLHAATGKWKRDNYEWHTFSFHHAPAISGVRAAESYLAEAVVPHYVVPEDENWPAFHCASERLPDLRIIADDIYVWSEGLAWTMAFTHEQEIGLGPYFSRREWVHCDH